MVNLNNVKIDLRNIPESCSSHPVVKLSQALNSLEVGVAKIEIVFKPSDIPMSIVELFLSRHGFKVVEKKTLQDGSVLAVGVKD